MSIASLLRTAAFVLAAFGMTPSAFASSAHITKDGALTAGSSGIGAITVPSAGVYCLLPSSSTNRAKQAAGQLFPAVTFDWANSPGFVVVAGLANTATPGYGGACPSSQYIEVVMISADGTNPVSGHLQQAAFDITF